MAQFSTVAALANTPSHRVRRPAKSLTGFKAMAESHSLAVVMACLLQNTMHWKTNLWIGIGMLAVLFVLFEVRLDLQFSLPGESQHLDLEQEARYAACYADHDKEIHDVAFGTIDNPDVQKLYISNNRDKAASECRLQFPERWVAVDEPFRFKLLDLQFRY